MRTLSPILWDFSILTTAFGKGKKLVTLNGKQGLSWEISHSQKHFADTLKKRRRGVILSFTVLNRAKPPLPLTVNLTSSQQQQLEAVLSKYQYVFQPPQTSPPARIYDPRIPLKEGFLPIAVKPYRYPYFQKNEIEKQIRELLQSGIIQPTSSPYSSPVC